MLGDPICQEKNKNEILPIVDNTKTILIRTYCEYDC